MKISFTKNQLYHFTGSCKAANGMACIFPFQYQGKTYDKCAKAGNNGIPWCVTKVHAFGRFDWYNCDNVTCTDGGVSPQPGTVEITYRLLDSTIPKSSNVSNDFNSKGGFLI